MKSWLHFFLLLVTLWVSIIIIIPLVHSKCIPDQQQSLLDFKSSLLFNSSLSSKLITWNSSTDCCSWVGVTCNTNGRVLGLDLSSESISGGIDNSSGLFHLQHLQRLNLADNELGNGSQSIPSAVGQLMNLRYLNLSQNAYSGQIPIEISRLTRLAVLDISLNYFIVDPYKYIYEVKLEISNLHMLVENLTELRELYLDDVQIPAEGSEWCQAISSSLPNLRVLSLSYCNLSGPFNESLANLRSLSVILLGLNNISAPVPAFFANFSNLTSLILNDCNLQGTFPKEIFQLPSLRGISLFQNEKLDGSLPEFPKNGSLQYLDLSGTNFLGALPNSIGNLKMLSAVDIGGCNFTGSIPKSMTNLTQLVSLWMYGNNFEGSIPSFSGAKNLEDIVLFSNGLTGNINCNNWGNLTNLVSLDLSYNMLSGNIPSSLFSLPSLNDIDLSDNQFFGHFPEISNLSSYYVKGLYLRKNNLEGPIPMSIFNFRGLTSLYLSSNNFSGSFPLDGLQHLRNLSSLDLSHNSLLLSHDVTNLSYSYFPQFDYLGLASLNLRTFPDFLRNQSKLLSLDLSDNQIQGKIPNWIWRSNNLHYLNLSCNSLETLEGHTINLTSMESLDLHSNKLHGKIPISSSPNMLYLDYSRNNFSSTIPTTIEDMILHTRFFSVSSNNLQGIIPGSICNTDSLEVLDMSNNSLSGTVPHCLTTMSTLSVLNLRRNNLRNVYMLSHNCSLHTLDISENHIQSQFLKSLVKCPQLQVLNLGKNQITGPFPCFLKDISTLRVLILRSNKFYGGISCPKINGTWPMLQIIDLAHNNFSGNVSGIALTTWQAMMANEDDASSNLNHLQFQDNSSGVIYYQDTVTITNKGFEMELVKILTVFTSIDFSCNNFNGSIPYEIGELKSLHILNLSNNAFTGAIPSSLSNLSQLESLDLSQNTLSGQIPLQLTKLTFLSFLNLSHNQLVGKIPSSNQFPTFPKSSFEGNKDLFGPPLTEENRTRLSSPTTKRTHPSYGDEIDWNIVIVEIGFTCGFGIVLGSLLFCKRWRKWYYRAMYSILVKIFPQLEQRFGHHRRHVYIGERYRRH
ncbi:putative leucine-rich repeat-containing, plant-type, leucine-rich repeat domain, L [Rosa chinensis]|uniref:Putative leucine-rich repeat-containing, plant-type, leucine-rich repeat domain, L n=1 Tax=Rosa chinensis TaxID=74649 RepID=A0A2P6R8U5_ROSCH|nr:receptor-like protein 35 [Rosa chinensis]PRQ42839.1 putative leucine-rich repeat-containing, plant-type, leucine-rich repeat domain, L [Rosa chinensis]